MSADTKAMKELERKNALKRVEVAKDRIARVERGEDAGLKKPFSPNDPAYLAAGEKMARAVRDLHLIPGRGSAKRVPRADGKIPRASHEGN